MAAPAPGGGFARGGSFGAGAGMGPEGLSAVPRMGAPVLGAIHPGMGKVSRVARVGQAIWYLPAHLAAQFLGLCLACMYVQVID
jgi:hypothetical protein